MTRDPRVRFVGQQVDPDPICLDYVVAGWACPMCGTTSPPRETPAGTFCVGPCKSKLVSCCEGAALPPKESA